MSDSQEQYNGYCPEYGKRLVTELDEVYYMEVANGATGMKVRCPSCREHQHQLDQLEWRPR